MVDYCIALYLKEQEERAYRIYVTDYLYCLQANISAYLGGGAHRDDRFADIFKKEIEESAEEIVDDVLEKCGLN